ncbi:unnamed protein product [Brassica napus]|uniref:RING-type E3 ubiquitin transferase n=3 Tax=Brassica TaxID=3705 RepID=A0A816RD94_BRANA|nr:unnamed protein product [Brassica napus]
MYNHRISIYTLFLCFLNFHQNFHFSFGSFLSVLFLSGGCDFKKLKIMVDPQTPIPPHLYPQAVQLKLYQAFIFSIPILFSIILFLLFYLFYLKRRASALSSPPPMILPVSSTHQPSSHLTSVCLLDVKVELKDKLHVVFFNEDLETRDSLCCVCLGEFELKEELVEMPSCKHIFHLDCIHLWLYSHTTCPLCRSSVFIPSIKTSVDDNDHPDSSQTSPV